MGSSSAGQVGTFLQSAAGTLSETAVEKPSQHRYAGKAAAAVGIDFAGLVETILMGALKRDAR